MNFNLGGDIPYQKAYEILKEMSEAVECGWIKLRAYREVCATTPGVRFEAGVTFPEAIDKFIGWTWVEINKNKDLIRIKQDCLPARI